MSQDCTIGILKVLAVLSGGQAEICARNQIFEYIILLILSACISVASLLCVTFSRVVSLSHREASLPTMWVGLRAGSGCC